MNDTQIKTLDQVRQFLEGTRVIDLVIDAKEDRYAWIQHTLIRFRYRQLSKADKGLLLGFLQNKHGVKQTRRQVLHYNITPLPYAHNFSLLGSQGVYTQRINRADLTPFFAGIV